MRLSLDCRKDVDVSEAKVPSISRRCNWNESPAKIRARIRFCREKLTLQPANPSLHAVKYLKSSNPAVVYVLMMRIACLGLRARSASISSQGYELSSVQKDQSRSAISPLKSACLYAMGHRTSSMELSSTWFVHC